MRILVTGANGYLGQGIVRHLLDLGVEVIAADFSVDYVDERAERIACSLFDVEDPYTYFKQPDVLLHLAWRDGFVHYSDAHLDDLPKHYHFISRMAESDIATIAVMGSMHEIGFYEGCIKENTPCHPTTPYGISKNALRELSDMLCKKHSKNFIGFVAIILLATVSVEIQFSQRSLPLRQMGRRNSRLQRDRISLILLTMKILLSRLPEQHVRIKSLVLSTFVPDIRKNLQTE